MSLRKYILNRVLQAFVVVFFVATTVFASVRAIPGDPVRLMLGGDADAETIRNLREQLGLNEPMHIQYIRWWERLLQGNLGESIQQQRPVTQMLIDIAEPTISIAILGMTIALLIAVPIGIISATRRYEVEDYAATTFAFLGISMPEFWIGILLIFATADVEFLSTYGYTSIDEGVFAWFGSVILPSIAVALPYGGTMMRMMRSSMMEVLNQDYMRTARAKGLSGRLVLFKHGLQNAILPVVTLAGIGVAVLLGGIVSVEIVFGISGLGRMLINSIERRDFPVVQGAVIVISCIFVFMNLFVDLFYTVINPKIRYGGGE